MNDTVTHLTGVTKPSQLTLRRGMTSSVDLWAWMAAASLPGRPVTANGQITMLDGAGSTQARFLLAGCLPVRLRGPALNAQTGILADRGAWPGGRPSRPCRHSLGRGKWAADRREPLGGRGAVGQGGSDRLRWRIGRGAGQRRVGVVWSARRHVLGLSRRVCMRFVGAR